MPLYRDITIPDKGRLSIWKITENPVFFSEKLHFSYTESEEFNNIKHPNRQLEWLAARWLLHQLTGTNTQRYSIQKDHFGKPSFEDHPMFFSLSHSVNYVAALISEKDCGLDLQLLDERILNVIPKFLSERELTFIKPQSAIVDATICWTIKEAVYKAYGKKQLALRDAVTISRIEGSGMEFKASASIEKENENLNYEIIGYGHNLYIASTAYKV